VEKVISVEGMSCGHCKTRVESILKSIDGVENAQVNLEEKNVVVIANKKVSDAVLKEAILDAGFDVENIIEK
jgi:copper ion binding protein